MAAFHVASQCTLPEDLPKRMLFLGLLDQLMLQFKGDFLPD
jgi:hypothetical protein